MNGYTERPAALARIRLTWVRIGDFPSTPNATLSFVCDSEVPAAAVRATAGANAFVIQRKLAGKTSRMTIGEACAWDIDEVRAEDRRLQALRDERHDPRQVKADRNAAAEGKAEAARCETGIAGEARRACRQVRRVRWSEWPAWRLASPAVRFAAAAGISASGQQPDPIALCHSASRIARAPASV
jgi:hypothetical protein